MEWGRDFSSAFYMRSLLSSRMSSLDLVSVRVLNRGDWSRSAAYGFSGTVIWRGNPVERYGTCSNSDFSAPISRLAKLVWALVSLTSG